MSKRTFGSFAALAVAGAVSFSFAAGSAEGVPNAAGAGAGSVVGVSDVGLLGHWSFDDAGGANSVSAKSPAVFSGKVALVKGVVGNAVEFGAKAAKSATKSAAGAAGSGGAPAAGAVVSHEILPQGVRALTFAAWVRPSGFRGHNTIFRKEDTADMRLLLAFQNDGRFLTLGLNCGRNYRELDAPLAAGEVADGRWHHVAGSFDGKVMRVYLDGREIGSLERGAPLNTAWDFIGHRWARVGEHPGAPLGIGAVVVAPRKNPDGSLTAQRFDEPFLGGIDEARFYARALSGTEVAALAAAGNAPGPDAAEVAAAAAAYKRAGSFAETLAATAAAGGGSGDAGGSLASALAARPRLAVELFRRLRADFPEAAAAYVAKWEKNPVELLALDAAGRAALAAKLVKEGAFEYLPLTRMQWDVLSATNRAKWTRVKAVKDALDAGKTPPVADLLVLEDTVEPRPLRNERVALPGPPTTPETKDRTAAEAREILIEDWLFQCDNKPTLKRCGDEIGYTKKLLARIRLDAAATGAYSAKIDALAERLRARIAANTAATGKPAPVLKITKAAYGPAGDAARTRDVTAILARQVLAGGVAFEVTNENLGGDPADGVPKELRVTYTLDGAKPVTAVAGEYATLRLGAATAGEAAEDRDLYIAIRELKREITFKNPVVDFDSVVYTDSPKPGAPPESLVGKGFNGRAFASEWEHEMRHRLGYMGSATGGRLLVQKGLDPSGHLTQIAPAAPIHGNFWRPDLSFDGKRVLFSFRPHNEKTFHLYEVNIDGTGLRQLTSGMFDDLDPVYLPDGKHIVFTTTRGYIYVRCMPPTNATCVARMPLDVKPGDKSLYLISRNGEPEYTPSVLDDGRVIYTRWEYTDKPLWRAQSLWTMNQNGSNVQVFWGNQSVWPDLLKDARSIPGSRRVMFTGSAHHNWFGGSVGILDVSKGLNFPDGLTKVTQEVAWPEVGNGPVDPKETADWHPSGKFRCYYSPYPLSEKDFLVSATRVFGYTHKYSLYLMDVHGNRELINHGDYNLIDAQPVRKRPVPPVQDEELLGVSQPTWENRDKPAAGALYSSNVYEGAEPELRGKVKFLRIWSIEHKTYTYWYKRPYASSGPEISYNQSDGVKKIIGTVPVEDDGSVNFQVPSGIAVHFQLLDKDQRALKTMKSFTGVQPGENRGCFGCHEMHTNSATGGALGKALRRRPSPITPVPWKDISVSYERYVQPVLDKYCGNCHGNPNTKAGRRFLTTLRPGFLGFKEPYLTLLGNPTWGGGYSADRRAAEIGRNTGTGGSGSVAGGAKGTNGAGAKDGTANAANAVPGGFGWADTILVESYSTANPAAYVSVPALKKLSYKSRLVELMASGKHKGVKVDDTSLLRVIHWVDAMGPFYGSDEVRKMEDPTFLGAGWLSQKPRINTAPVVQRPGPFDVFHPEEDPAYFTPAPDAHNRLPNGVQRR